MFKVVDIFAGPGGLAEGFSSYCSPVSHGSPFRVALSVEMEASAFNTLRLRAFRRQFGKNPPLEYDALLAGRITAAELAAEYPDEWGRAAEETHQLTLGTPEAEAKLNPLIDNLRQEQSDHVVLVGGPPCQAYSLVGRSRNSGNIDYVASKDHRHFLYREYIRILARLSPAAFIMENVKGFLSAKVDGQEIFPLVMEDLDQAGSGYHIFPLAPAPGTRNGGRHVVHAERFGVPQARHRVILFGVRKDLWPEGAVPPTLEPELTRTTVSDVLEGMPALRSGLTKGDTESAWRAAVLNGFRMAADALTSTGDKAMQGVIDALRAHAATFSQGRQTLPTRSIVSTPVRHNVLGNWLQSKAISPLPNHDARDHNPGDLARYAFVATYTEVMGHSPKTKDFPAALAADHRNWDTGKFADRFRAQRWDAPATTITSHLSKDGHYFIHPDPQQCRSLSVREAARLQTFPDDYLFTGPPSKQRVQVGNAVPPLLACRIAGIVHQALAMMGLTTENACASPADL